MAEKETLEKLLAYQQDLQSEEECLKKIISKLNDQAHALQVEQLHILNAINKSTGTNVTNNEDTMNGTQVHLKKETTDPESQELDLRVPTYQSSEEDEDEMEE